MKQLWPGDLACVVNGFFSETLCSQCAEDAHAQAVEREGEVDG
jgi:hypothetical protein